MPTKRYVTGPPLWLALGTIYIVWGSTYFGIAVAVESMPPFLMLAIRFAIAGGLLLGWELLRQGRAGLPTRREIRDSAIVGALLLGIGNGFVALGEAAGVASGIAAILVAMMPLWLGIFGWLYFRERLPRLAIVGVVIGLVGVTLLVWPFGGGSNPFNLLGVAVLLVAPIGWAHGSLFSAHRAQLPSRPLMASALQMLAGAGFLALEGVLTGELGRFDPAAVTTRSLVALVYLITIGSMLGFNAFAWLLRHAPLSLIGTYAYVNPVVAVGLGTIFLAEPITPRTLVASAVILAAVAMIVTSRSRAARPSEVDSPEEAIHAADGRPATAQPANPASRPVSLAPTPRGRSG